MRTHRIGLAATGLVACVSLLLAGCGSDEPDDTGTGAPAETTTAGASAETSATEQSTEAEPEAATITIRDFAYGEPLTVAPGTTVTVVNEDSAPHNAIDADGAWEFDLLQPGESTTFTAPEDAGTYDLICTQHAQMSGQLIVEG